MPTTHPAKGRSEAERAMTKPQQVAFTAFVLWVCVGVITPSHAGAVNATRREAAARIYVASIESARLAESTRLLIAARPPDRSDESMVDVWKLSGLPLAPNDVSIVAKGELEDRTVSFYEAHLIRSSGPISYVVGVNAQLEIFRLQGFDDNDFSLMMTDRPVSTEAEALARMQLFYRLTQSMKPGPVTDADVAREAVRRLRDSGSVAPPGGDGEARIEPLTLSATPTGWAIECYVFDAESTRLEKHEVEVSRHGSVLIKSREAVRDVKVPHL